MHKEMLTILVVTLLAAGTVVASAGQASAKTQKPAARHHVVHPGSDITSFSSSSSGLHVGVNHPPKNR